MKPFIIAGIASLALLTGCTAPTTSPTPSATSPVSTSPVATTSPTPSPTPTPAITAFTCEGANDITYRFTVPPPADHPVITQLEEWRIASGVTEQRYPLVIEIDATKATQDASMLLGMGWQSSTGDAVQARVGVTLTEGYSAMSVDDILGMNDFLTQNPDKGHIGYDTVNATQDPTGMQYPYLVTDIQMNMAHCEPD